MNHFTQIVLLFILVVVIKNFSTKHRHIKIDSEVGFTKRARNKVAPMPRVTPMDADEVRKIDIDPSKVGCTINPKHYYVKKVFPNFFASLDPRFEKHPIVKEKYKDQIGYIYCKKGFINYVSVNDRPQKLNARGCGLATVFTVLCMVDEDLDMLPPSEIRRYFSDYEDMQNIITTSCRRFVGLMMSVEKDEKGKIGGAYAYFSAALKSNYQKMLIQNECEICGIRSGHYTWMKTSEAKEKYNIDTGNIGKIMANKEHWWFCDDIEGQIPEKSYFLPCPKPERGL